MILNNGETNKNIIMAVIISILILSMSIIHIIRLNGLDQANQYEAEVGVIDLYGYDFNETVFLDGEWEFYPNILLGPEDNFDDYKNIKKYVDVPGNWESYLDEDGRVNGSGTYRLKIIVPENGDYGFKTRTIRSSSRIFANGNEIINLGKPAIDKSDYEIDSRYKLGFFHTSSQEIDLIINVSNFGIQTGGIIKPIEFGSEQAIIRLDRTDRLIDGVTVTAALVLGLYFISSYVQRGRDKELYYLGLISILTGIYLASLNEQLLDTVINYKYTSRIQILFILLLLIAICLLRFSNYFFKNHVKKGMTIGITSLAITSILLVLFIPAHSRVEALRAYNVLSWGIMFICFIYTVYLFIKNMENQLESLEYTIIIISALLSFSIAMVTKTIFDIDLGRILSVLMLILLVATSFLINNKHQIDYKKVQSLSKRLLRDDQLKDEFLARASHELKTPLHVILNSSQSLIEGKKGALNSEQQESLFFINQEGKRLSNLVSDLLDASQVSKGESNIRIRPFNAYKIVENILREMAGLIGEDKDILLLNELPEDAPLIDGDPDKFTQIIYNLVRNSIEHTHIGKITVTANAEDGQVYFKVSDTGVGIKEEEITEIFNTFYKGSSNNLEESGMGLGLSITKHLVEMLGGDIRVESSYGKGTSFIFNLPIYEGNQEAKDLNPIIKSYKPYEYNIEAKDYNINNPTILIVDDRLSNMKVLADILYELDYNILFARDGKEALDIVEKSKVDLMVLDFMLPDYSGAEICEKLREKYSLYELPILMLTASERSIDMKRSYDHGANDFLRKPAQAEELIAKIESLLSMKKSVEESISKEFKYFYSQISPHFLFNTLNTIIGISYEDSERARQALTNLSIYFRGKLEMYRDKTLIPLESELELVRAYLEIEEMRFGDRLKVNIEIDEDLESMIPPLSIQPLVENSLRHGIRPKGEGYINISVKKDGDLAIIEIEDNGLGMSEEKQKELLSGSSDRLGFKNVLAKLKMIKGAELKLYSKELEGTSIIISIPEVKKYASYISG